MEGSMIIVILVSAVMSVITSFAVNFYFRMKYDNTLKELKKETKNQKFILSETITNIITQNDIIKESLEDIKGHMKDTFNAN